VSLQTPINKRQTVLTAGFVGYVFGNTNILNIDKKIPDNVISSRNACLSHAEDLIRAARRILADEKLPNISYHLAVLALEEIGKSTLIVMGHFDSKSGDSTWSPHKFYDNHVKKLFWATWGPSMGQEKISKKQIESLQGLSHRIHDTRLQALYVDFDEDGPLLPSDVIPESEAQNLIDAATARLELEKLHKFGEIEEKNLQSLNWFLTATSDQEKRKLIFGNKSMEKLAELKSTKKWVDWLKQEFDKAEKEGQEAINQELQRKPPSDTEKLQDKWKIKIRLFSNSHSIRPKPLNKWNELGSWIRLYPVGGKKNQLLVEFTLPKSISVHALWWAAWGAARRFVVALNIGTFGCFWWYVPEQISRFYEKITDLENKEMEVKIERNPILKLDWKHSALSDTDLRNAALCFGMLPGDNESELGKSMGAYITALGFLNKSDIHLQFEGNSYDFFYKSLKHGMKHFKEWNPKTSFPDCFERLLQGHKLDQKEIENHKKIAQQIETGRPSFKGVTLSLSEVGMMKVICDAYFIVKFNQIAKKRESKKNKKGT
jgi:AbiV family abortive infection protein